jgi:hypothetical protein
MQVHSVVMGLEDVCMEVHSAVAGLEDELYAVLQTMAWQRKKFERMVRGGAASSPG